MVRLKQPLKAEAERLAAERGSTLDQFVNAAVAEKIAFLRARATLAERAARADDQAFDDILARAGAAEPQPDDGLPEGWDDRLLG